MFYVCILTNLLLVFYILFFNCSGHDNMQLSVFSVHIMIENYPSLSSYELYKSDFCCKLGIKYISWNPLDKLPTTYDSYLVCYIIQCTFKLKIIAIKFSKNDLIRLLLWYCIKLLVFLYCVEFESQQLSRFGN